MEAPGLPVRAGYPAALTATDNSFNSKAGAVFAMTKVGSGKGVRSAQSPEEPVIVSRSGRVARLESSLTPHEAQIEDLVFVRKVLKKANIPFLLIRDHKNRPVLAIDIELRSAVETELTTACAIEPMYAKTVDVRGLSPVLLAEARLSNLDDPRIVRLYRRRIPPGGFRYGSRFGVELQFWAYEETVIRCPVENSLTRTVLPRREM